MAKSRKTASRSPGKTVTVLYDLDNLSQGEAERRAATWLETNPHEHGDTITVTDQAIWKSGRA